MNFIETNNLNWINVSDIRGWDGQAAKDYYIYATPTMILIDTEQKIIAKPSDINDLKEWF